MEDCEPVDNPLDPGAEFEKLNDNELVVNLKEFQFATGSLTHALIGTRPDVWLQWEYSVNTC